MTPGRFYGIAAKLVIAMVPPIVIDHTLGEDLHFEWSVEKVRGPSPDMATLRIHNLGQPLRKALEAYVGTAPIPLGIALFVGWDKLAEQLFTGISWKVIPEKEEGTDWVTTIECGDGAVEARDTPPSGAAWFGAPFAEIVHLTARKAGYTVSPATLAVIETAVGRTSIPAIQAQLQLVDLNEPRDELDGLMASLGLSWGSQDGEFVVFDNGLRNDLLPSILTPTTGLLSWSVLDDGGLEFEALCQARVVPGIQVQVNDLAGAPIGGGPLRVERISFSGTTDGPSVMRGVARKVEILA